MKGGDLWSRNGRQRINNKSMHKVSASYKIVVNINIQNDFMELKNTLWSYFEYDSVDNEQEYTINNLGCKSIISRCHGQMPNSHTMIQCIVLGQYIVLGQAPRIFKSSTEHFPRYLAAALIFFGQT